MTGLLTATRRAFYNLDGPWYRRGLFEAFGSTRYSRPALFGMDARLAKLMPWRDGVFVEAGAHDGYTQSNTYYLERYRGWSGVLVEPIPELRRKCERRRGRSRVLECALVGPEDDGKPVTIHFGDLMSSAISGQHAAGGLAVAGRHPYTIDAPGRTLSSVLSEASIGHIDVMILDLEGAELAALSGLDLKRHRPKYLVIETLDRAAQQPALDAALSGHYVFSQALSAYDLLYALGDGTLPSGS